MSLYCKGARRSQKSGPNIAVQSSSFLKVSSIKYHVSHVCAVEIHTYKVANLASGCISFVPSQEF